MIKIYTRQLKFSQKIRIESQIGFKMSLMSKRDAQDLGEKINRII